MMKTLPGMIMPGDPLMIEAAEALRRYHEAQAANSPAQEVERCRLLAESLFDAINDLNLRALGLPSHRRH
jgi:hypothetical protein